MCHFNSMFIKCCFTTMKFIYLNSLTIKTYGLAQELTFYIK